MIDSVQGITCRACSGRLSAAGDGTYVCVNCETTYEVTDMFLP